MKNIPELPCAIVEDLLPAYVEGLTSEETTAAVEAHLASCPACAAKRAAMGAEEGPSPEEAAETAREVDYLKAVRRRSRRRVAAAILCTVLVLAAAALLKIFVIGTAGEAHHVALAYTEESGDTLSLNVYCLFGPNAFYGWAMDETEDGVVSFTAREVRASPLHTNDQIDLEVPLEGLKEVWVCGRLCWQDGTPISDSTLALYNAQTPYVGDNSAVGRVLAEVDHWYGPIGYDYTISLQTSSEPYGLTIHFSDVTAHVLGAGKAIDDWMYEMSPTLLALIGNLEQVQWTYAAPDGTAVTRSVTLEEVDAALPDWIEARNLAHSLTSPDEEPDWTAPESIKDYAASPAAVQRLIDLTDYGFYVHTVEDGANVFTPWP